jgi:hypothetical protein
MDRRALHDLTRRPSAKYDPAYEAYRSARARRARARDELLNDAHRAPLDAWARRAAAILLIAANLCRVTALVLALTGGHWLFVALLLLTWMPVRAVGGYVIGLWLVDLLVFVAGLALGLSTLAFIGILIPAAVYVTHVAVFAGRNDAATRRRETRLRKLDQWRERIARTPADRDALEDVVFEMRDWWMTPTQAVRVACDAGAPPDLANDVVFLVVRWPGLEDPELAEEGWQWERLL